MPRIPTYVAQQTPSGSLPYTAVAPLDLSGPQRLLDQTLANYQREQEQERRRQEIETKRLEEEARQENKRIEAEKARVDLVNTMGDVDSRWVVRLDEMVSEGPAEGLAQRVGSEFDKERSKILEGAPEKARAGLAVELAQKRLQLFRDAHTIERRGRVAGILQADDDGTDADARALLTDPTQFEARLARRSALGAALELPEDMKAARSAKARDKLVYAAATGYAQMHPHETLRALEGAPLTPAQVPSANDDFAAVSAAQEGAQARAEQLAILESEANDPRLSESDRAAVQREIERVKARKTAPAVPSAPAHPALSMLPPERVDDIIRVARQSIERGTSQERVLLADTARNVQAAVSAGVPVASAEVAGLRERYVAAYGVDGARRYDEEVGAPLLVSEQLRVMRGATAEQRHAIIAAAQPTKVEGAARQLQVFDAVTKADAAIRKQLTTDPATYALGTSPQVNQAYQRMLAARDGDDVKAASANYAMVSRAEQQRLGAPTVRLLTTQQAQAIAKMFNESRPEDAADLIAQLEDQWRQEFPTIYLQLAQENHLSPAALVIPNMKDQASRARLARVSAVPTGELDSMLEPGARSTLKGKLQEKFTSAARTFVAQSGKGLESLGAIMGQAEKLAIVYQSGGKSADQAAAQAYDEVMGWRYTFKDTYRVPNEEQPAVIVDGADLALEGLGRISLFESPLPMGAANRESQSLDAIRANSFWVTSADETGLELKVRGKDNGVYTAKKADGKPVQYKWAELRRLVEDDRETERRMVEAGQSQAIMARRKQRAEEFARIRRLREMGLPLQPVAQPTEERENWRERWIGPAPEVPNAPR